VTTERILIVNADDFGQTSGINRGILAAYERGIVTRASLMVRWPAAGEAAAIARTRPELAVGLHVDLGEWRYEGGAWLPLYDVVPLMDADAVRAEIARQISAFRRLMGREPTHLDSHQHVHRREPTRSVLVAFGRELGVGVRHFCRAVAYCGAFYGQMDNGDPLPEAISPDSLIAVLRELPAGVTELVCHPGYADGLTSMYAAEREEELRTLCDPRVRSAVLEAEIRLCATGERFRTRGERP
jgi:predicted glycoside hydrolase/deacetylase ChbG (UPF0249 family)